MTRTRTTFNNLQYAVNFLSRPEPGPQGDYLVRDPAVWAEGDQIYWKPTLREQSPTSHVSIPADLYLRFARLADAPVGKIVAFAGKWGPLRMRYKNGSEPIADWHQYSQLAKALLLAAASLQGGIACDANQWKIIGRMAYRKGLREHLRPGEDSGVLRSGIAACLNNLYNNPQISKILVGVEKGQFQLSRSSIGLWGTILEQLALAIVNRKPFSVCSGCGRRFLPKQLPKRGKRRYCVRKACRRAAQRDAARDYRARKKAEDRH
jgi:hypothetical protein